jgi:hypothetical protein
LFLILSDFDCDNIKKIYNYLFYLFPYFKEQDIARFFNESLTPGGSSAPPFQKLINYAPALKDQQRDLSLFLALWHKRQAALVPIEQRLIFYSEAMHYFATASNIAKTQGGIALVEEITLSASNILIKIAETHAESFEEKLERAGRGGRHEDVAELFMHVDSLKRLCIQKKIKFFPKDFIIVLLE